jgi:ATP-dependent Clp protease adaptor protein ClpS
VLPEIEELVRKATAIASAGGWPGPAPEHLLLAILDEPAGAAVLENAGADVAELRTQTHYILRGAPKRDIAIQPWLEAVEGVEAQSGRGPINVATLLAQLMAVPMAPIKLLEDQGVSRADVLSVIEHGVARTKSIPTARLVNGGRAVGAKGRYNIVFHNDSYTTYNFVCYLLERHFDLDPDEARDLALEISNTGSAALGPYKLKQALRLVEMIASEAYEAGFPLKLSCEALPD